MLLVPEQASLQTERALVCDGPITATARGQVLSFRRLAVRILDQRGGLSGIPLSAPGRAMLLRAVVGRLGRRLRYYRRVERLTGFFDRLGGTIGELIDGNISPDDLRRIAESDAQSVSQRSLKLHDLAAIHESYLNALGEDRIDPSRILDLARKQLAQSDFLRGAQFWVDGFAGFTELERQLLCDLIVRAERTTITLLIDPAYHARTMSLTDIEPGDLFAPTQRTYLHLRSHLTQRGVSVHSTVASANDQPPRFVSAPAIGRLESALSADHAQPEDAQPVDAVRLIEAPDRRAEVAYAVGQIREAVTRDANPLRYRDIAVVTRDLALYHDLIAEALQQHEIPYFIDRRRPAGHHPLVEFVRAVVGLAADDFGVSDIRLLLKTGLAAINEAAADELENHILATGVSGATRWTSNEWCIDRPTRRQSRQKQIDEPRQLRLNQARRTILEQVMPFVEFAASEQSANAWSQALVQLLETSGAIKRVERWARSAEGEGRINLADAHRQVTDLVTALFDDLASGLGDTELTVRELRGILDAGFSQLTLGLAPPTVDQVLVGSIDRSRNPNLRHVIVLGLNEGVFPKRGGSDSLLGDDDRALLTDYPELGASDTQRALEEKLLLYIAATRASERVTFSYAAASDARSQSLEPSRFVESLREALPELSVTTIVDSTRPEPIDAFHSTDEIVTAITDDMRDRPPIEQDDVAARQRINNLYAAARLFAPMKRPLQRALSALTQTNDATLSPKSAASLFPGTYKTSVSELETFAACPFKRFARYGLRLRERDLSPLEARDMGTVHHAVLEDLIAQMIRNRDDVASLNEAQLISRLEQSSATISATFDGPNQPAAARDAHWIRQTAKRLTPALRQQLRAFQCGDFRPIAVEAAFGIDDAPNSLPALSINTPKGRRVQFRGYIDRIDAAQCDDDTIGVVVDYKSNDKQIRLYEIRHGLALQLVAYMIALRDIGRKLIGESIKPAGAVYVTLRDHYKNVDHPEQADPESGVAKARGILDAAKLDLFENDAPDGWSRVLQVFRKKDGSLGIPDKTDAISSDDFQAVLSFVEQTLGRLADDVLDGQIAVIPYRLGNESPCTYCEYRPVCRFEIADGSARYLTVLKRDDAIEQMKATTP